MGLCGIRNPLPDENFLSYGHRCNAVSFFDTSPLCLPSAADSSGLASFQSTRILDIGRSFMATAFIHLSTTWPRTESVKDSVISASSERKKGHCHYMVLQGFVKIPAISCRSAFAVKRHGTPYTAIVGDLLPHHNLET